MRDYPLEVMELNSRYEEPIGYFSKGHHSFDELLEAAKKIELEMYDEEAMFEGCTLEHGYWRTILTKDGVAFYDGQPGQRGVYPVTILKFA